jgi:tetratricopeptide (TPR) repeat protein
LGRGNGKIKGRDELSDEEIFGDRSREMHLLVERLKRLPQHMDEIWQGGLARVPSWVAEEGCPPYRPWMSGWISTRTKLANVGEPQKDKDLEQVLTALVDFACDPQLAGYRPGGLDVRDADLAAYLGEKLADAGIVVEQRKTLYTWDKMLEHILETLGPESSIPSALSVKGITVEAMRSFAEAACAFYRAAPWRHLAGEDLVAIESPFVDAAMRYVSVLGGHGLCVGIGFYDTRARFDEVVEKEDPDILAAHPYWVLYFDPIPNVPLGDADLWQDHNLPVAEAGAYPWMVCYCENGKFRRPGPDMLAFVEGLLRVLAQTTEEQMDAGRWEKEVATFDGPMTFTLALPNLLEAETSDSSAGARRKELPDPRSTEPVIVDLSRLLEGRASHDFEEISAFLKGQIVDGQVPHRAPQTPIEEAQEIMYEAFDAVGRRQLQLIHKALAICPDCVDAHVLLAERCGDPEEALVHYERGVAAGERTLGPKAFEEDAGHFWGVLKTRPYMRARLGLAMSLDESGHLAEAAGHYRELLRLNPNDNQGVRECLLPDLIELGADEEAAQLWKQYSDDDSAIWNYARALLMFRQKGDTAVARKRLKKAIEANGHVPELLLTDEPFVSQIDEYGVGSREEAMYCAELLKDAWEATEGAVEWLEAQW